MRFCFVSVGRRNATTCTKSNKSPQTVKNTTQTKDNQSSEVKKGNGASEDTMRSESSHKNKLQSNAVILTVLLSFLHICECHVGSVLPFGEVITNLGERKQLLQNLEEIIYCSFIKQGDGKPPTLSHIRVSRGPDPAGNKYFPNEDNHSWNSGLSPLQGLKSPSYQHKINRISQFHNNPHSNSYSDVTYNIHPLSNAPYPVASLYVKGDSRRDNLDPYFPNQEEDGVMADFGHPNNNYDQEPTFTPFIATRALSNMPRFFEHLNENLQAIRDGDSTELGSSSVSVESYFPGRHQDKLDLPTRRGDYFQSDGRLSLNANDVGYDYSEGDEKPHNLDKTGEVASRDLLAYMGRDPKYKKANNYNPSWLFTNLGLGKRSNSRRPGSLIRRL